MPPRTLLNELSREEIAAVSRDGLAVLPVGATEQHGPHLPVGTDTMHTEHVVREAAARLAGELDVAVAPTLPYGCSPHHVPLGATLSLTSETFLRVVRELAGSLARCGFGRVFLVNGHGGNDELVRVAAREVSLEHGIRVGACSWWALTLDALAQAGATTGALPGHAGAFETSLVLALQPELVREPRPHRDDPPPLPVRYPRTVAIEAPGAWQRIDGYTDSPDRGRAEDGARWLELAVAELVTALQSFMTTE